MNKGNLGRFSIAYDITLACNNRCPYCYALGYLDNDKRFNHEVFDKFKKSFNQLDRTYEVELFLLGGEPLFVDEIQRIKELDLTNVTLVIFSNLNYSPEVLDQRLSLLEGVDYRITCSFHESSNTEYVIRNVGYLCNLYNNVDVSFFVNKENIHRIKGYTERICVFGVPYRINRIKTDYSPHPRFDFGSFGEDEVVLEGLLNKSDDSYEVTFGDRGLTSYEVHKFNISEISHIYFTKCELGFYKVDYWGEVVSACEYKVKHNISDKFKQHNHVLCVNKSCICDYTSYKKLLRPKDGYANKEFHEYFGG